LKNLQCKKHSKFLLHLRFSMNSFFANRYKLLFVFAYIILYGMAIYYCQERLCTDTGHYFFQTINARFFYVEHQRFVQVFAEWPIVLGMLVGLPLKVLTILYSCAHIFFFFSIGLLLYKKYKDVHSWLLLLFLQIIGFQIGFINPIIEHYYGIAIGVAVFSILRQSTQISTFIFCMLQLLAILLLTSHPFAMLLYIFILSIDFITRKNIRFFISMCIIIPFYFLFKSKFASQYEIDKSAWIFDTTINKTYLQLFTSNLWLSFGKVLFVHYWHWLLLFGINCAYFLKAKQYKILACMLFFILGTIVIIQFAYAVTSYSGQIEQACFAIIPYVLFPFFMLVLPNSTYQKPLFVLLVFIFLIGVISQNDFMQTYTAKTKRVHLWIAKARQQAGDKFTISASSYADINHLINWDIPFFSILLSAVDGGKQVSITPMADNNMVLINQLQDHQYLYRNNEVGELGTLNKKYFLIENSPYQKLLE
jgi:hypothetical protein